MPEDPNTNANPPTMPVPPAPTPLDDRPLAPEPKRPRAKDHIIATWEKKALYGFFALIVLVVGASQWWDAHASASRHDKTTTFAKEQFEKRNLSEADFVILTTSESLIGDTVALRHAGLFFGIIAIALGCMLVLTGIETGYQLSLDSAEIKGSLNASSPGLVLITLGVVLAIASLYRGTTIDEHPQPVTAASPGDHGEGVATTASPVRPTSLGPAVTGTAKLITTGVDPGGLGGSFMGSGAMP